MIEADAKAASFSPAGRRSRQGDEGPAASPKKSIALARRLRRDETDPEYRLWCELRGRRLNGFKFVRQFAVGPYVADFCCRTHWLIIEVDGSQHAESRRDEMRTAWLNSQHYSVLRFWNDELLTELGSVLDTILAALEGRLPLAADAADPSPGLRFAPATLSPQGRGMAPFRAPLADGYR